MIRDRKYMNEDGRPSAALLTSCINEQIKEAGRLKKLDDYYHGKHDILKRRFSDASLPNNRIVSNHAKYITDVITGYLHGAPVQYTGGNERLEEILTMQDEDSHNSELAKDISVFGKAYELLYMSNDAVPVPKFCRVDVLNAFVCYDNTLESAPMFGTFYNEITSLDGTVEGYNVTVYTDTERIVYFTRQIGGNGLFEVVDEAPHYFGKVPMIEYVNNADRKGDFEEVITLIDAYNKLQSDRVNDKEQLVDCLLAVSGVSFGDDMGEMSATAKALKELKILELPEGGSAQWLTKGLSEADTEILKQAIKDDIHEFSKVPCMTDANFAANSSGVAMRYKLFSLEQLGISKERYFKRGLRKRLELINNVLTITNSGIDLYKVDIVMKRTLPVDYADNADIAAKTEGLLSLETRIRRFDAEINVERELELLAAEKEEATKQQAQAFGSYNFDAAE